MSDVVIEPYNPLWPDQFKTIKDELSQISIFTTANIQHIGSTSVPGLDAKNVIDVQVSVSDLQACREARTELEELGYTFRPEFTDHVPAGLTDDPAFWTKQFWFRANPAPRIHLHIRQIGRPNQRFSLLFRDYLRSHTLAADAYAATKKTLAASISDTANYAEIKDPIIDIIMAGAEDWAAATNWHIPRD